MGNSTALLTSPHESGMPECWFFSFWNRVGLAQHRVLTISKMLQSGSRDNSRSAARPAELKLVFVVGASVTYLLFLSLRYGMTQPDAPWRRMRGSVKC